MSLDTWLTRWPRHWILRSALLCLTVATSGCVERRMTIRSEPSNALVVLDGQEIGHTPVSTSFTYYGEREIKLIKDGFETKTIKQTVSTPWYQYPGLDFISEVLFPFRIHDERNYLYTMEPALAVSDADLIERANIVRQEGQNPPPDVLRRAGLPDTSNSAIAP